MIPSAHFLVRKIRRTIGHLIDGITIVDHLSAGFSTKIMIPKISPKQNIILFLEYGDRNSNFEPNNFVSILDPAEWTVIQIRNDPQAHKPQLIDNTYIRPNLGYDIGAIAEVLRLFKNHKFENVLLVNDSFFFSKSTFRKMVSKAKDLRKKFDVVSLTDSYQVNYHLQSFFLMMSNDAAQIYSKSGRLWRWKRSAVYWGEIRISKLWSKNELRMVALVSYEELISIYLRECKHIEDYFNISKLILRNVPLNPTQHLWPAILKSSFPIMKISLIKDNPAKLRQRPTEVDQLNVLGSS